METLNHAQNSLFSIELRVAPELTGDASFDVRLSQKIKCVVSFPVWSSHGLVFGPLDVPDIYLLS
jgi:hypothetical protein